MMQTHLEPTSTLKKGELAITSKSRLIDERFLVVLALTGAMAICLRGQPSAIDFNAVFSLRSFGRLTLLMPQSNNRINADRAPCRNPTAQYRGQDQHGGGDAKRNRVRG
jgi:hypothetical protein